MHHPRPLTAACTTSSRAPTCLEPVTLLPRPDSTTGAHGTYLRRQLHRPAPCPGEPEPHPGAYPGSTLAGVLRPSATVNQHRRFQLTTKQPTCEVRACETREPNSNLPQLGAGHPEIITTGGRLKRASFDLRELTRRVASGFEERNRGQIPGVEKIRSHVSAESRTWNMSNEGAP